MLKYFHVNTYFSIAIHTLKPHLAIVCTILYSTIFFTKNNDFFLFFSVPPTSPLIRSEHGKVLDKFSDPVREGSTLTLICETQGGEPLPRLTWKRGQSVLDDVVEEVDTQNRVVRNYLKLPSLKRQDHDDVLACLASNTNLSVPLITYININMVCK